MKLSEIINDIEALNVVGNADVDIVDVDIDSRRVATGHLFVAIPGTQTDGHQYIAKAIEQGAAAVMCEEQWWNDNRPALVADGVAIVVVKSTNEAVA